MTSHGDANLVSFAFISLRRKSCHGRVVDRKETRVSSSRIFGAFYAVQIVSHVSKKSGIEMVQFEVKLKRHLHNQQVVNAGLIILAGCAVNRTRPRPEKSALADKSEIGARRPVGGCHTNIVVKRSANFRGNLFRDVIIQSGLPPEE